MKHEGWGEWASALGLELTAEMTSRLDAYQRILLERGAPMGLIAPNDVSRVRERHLLDSLRAVPLLSSQHTGYDLGSGGGLPGLVVAIARRDLACTLVEVRRNRAAFLDSVVAELGLENVAVYPRRAETLRERRDFCLARAFAPLGGAWAAARPLLVPGGSLIYWAGSRFDPSRDLPENVTSRIHRSPGLPGSGALVELVAP